METPEPKTDHESTTAQPERPLWLGIIGAALGGVAGYYGFFALLQYTSIYALILPGALIGLGRAMGAKQFSVPLGIACGIAALILSIAIEWQVAPHPEGETMVEFITRLHERPFRNVASIIAGPLVALWFGVGRRSPH